jgi:hypothetical protein
LRKAEAVRVSKGSQVADRGYAARLDPENRGQKGNLGHNIANRQVHRKGAGRVAKPGGKDGSCSMGTCGGQSDGWNGSRQIPSLDLPGQDGDGAAKGD